MRRVPWSVALLALFLGAFALRVFHIDSQSLWYDEAFSVYLAHFSLADITARTAADIQPPLYYYLLHFWIVLAGEGEFAMRYLALFFGALTVPLLYVTGQRLFGARAAFAAALLAALSPLYVWYSQETRMYTLITFLLLLSSYALLRALRPAPFQREGVSTETERTASSPESLQGPTSSSGMRRWWVVFALANIAAVYTHYFALVVIAFQVLYAAGASFRFQVSGLRAPSGGFRFQVPGSKLQVPSPKAPFGGSNLKLGTFNLKPGNWFAPASFAVIPIAFLPWAPLMLGRLGQDASYWQGALKLDEAVRHIFINLTTGESVLEAQAQWIAAGWLVALVIGLGAAVGAAARRLHAEGRDGKSAIAFSVLYLVIPLALLLFLFYRNPKFNARYLMIVSPALFLLLGAGLASLVRAAWRGRRWARVLAGTLAFLSFGWMLLTSVYADANAFYDPAFTKADFRGVARYLDEHLAPGEAIVMASGHMFPALDYYYRGDAPQVRLPDDPTLNTEHVLGYDTANVLNQTVAGRPGVWVVLWQDEVVDPNGFLPLLLASRGQEQKVDASFWQVKLRHWTLSPQAHFSTEPEPSVAQPANFKNKVKLLGLTPTPTTADRGASFNLYWQALDTLPDDYSVSLRVVDAAGNVWGKLDRRPAGYNYPTTRWKKDEKLFGAYTVPLLAGTPAGDYSVQVTLYTAADQSGLDILAPSGAPMGRTVKLGPIPVRAAAQPASYAALNIQNSLSQPLGPFTLLGYQLGRDKASAGETIPLTLFWRADTAPDKDYAFRVQLGNSASAALPLANAQFPTTRWRAGEVVRGQYPIRIPIDAAAATTDLKIALEGGAGQAVTLAPFTVEKTDRVFVAPPFASAQAANFGNIAGLVGYTLERTSVKPGENLKVTLVWQARGKADKPYTIFVHLLDAASKSVTQKDSEPLNGARPTTGWVENEYFNDVYELAVQSDTPPGQYTLEIGWYDAKDPAYARLPVLDENGAPAGDHVILKTPVTVGP